MVLIDGDCFEGRFRDGVHVDVSDLMRRMIKEHLLMFNATPLFPFILAVVEFMPDDTHLVYYIRRPFQCEPDFGVTRVNCDLCELIARGEAPA